LAEAEAWVLKSRGEDTDKAGWDLELARVYSAQYRHEEAYELYQRVVAARPADPGLLMDLASEAWAAELHGAAKKTYLKAYGLSEDPVMLYYLSELSFSAGDNLEGRRWAKKALGELSDPIDAREERIVLRLRSRLGWDDLLDEEFGRLFDANPGEMEMLAEWAGALMRWGHLEAAEEPLSLMRELFPGEELRWRKLEASRLSRLKADEALSSHLAESIAEFPDEPSLIYLLADEERKLKNWSCSERHLVRVATHPRYGESSRRMLLDVRREGHHHVGPVMRWRDSDSARSMELGVFYEGLPRAHIRVEAEAGQGTFEKKGGTTHSLSGADVSAALERARWTAGMDFSLWSGGGLTAASPGLFASARPEKHWYLTGHAFAARMWRDSVSALAAGGKKHELEASAQWSRLRPLRLSLRGSFERMRVSNGGSGTRSTFYPSAGVTLLAHPVDISVDYRYVLGSASVNDAFLRELSIRDRTRTHYITLSAGRRWFEERLRTDAYVFNGHDADRGWRFGTDNLVGMGVNIEYIIGRWVWKLGYSSTREDVAGAGEQSQGMKLMVLWRWPPKDRCKDER